MENTELLAEVRAKINESMQLAITREEVGMEMLFLYTQLQILERLEALHETLRSIDFAVDATAKTVAKEHGYVFLGKKDVQ